MPWLKRRNDADGLCMESLEDETMEFKAMPLLRMCLLLNAGTLRTGHSYIWYLLYFAASQT